MSFFSRFFKSKKRQRNLEGVDKVLSQQNAEKIISILRVRNALSSCLRCNGGETVLINGIFFMPMSEGLFGENIDTQIPYAGICCQNCGYTWHHSLQALGLTP